MLHAPLPSPGKTLRELMSRGVVTVPGVFNPLSAKAAQDEGARALYISGGATTNALLGVPDIALVSLEELARTAASCCQVTTIPIISDADTGFGETWNTTRTVIEMERAGLAGIHMEDQVSPKRCGHLEGKEVISAEQMATKIRAAVDAKRDGSFLVIARTDARHVEGLDAAIERAKCYLDSGADMIFPEGLESEAEFEQVREALPGALLLANMTEFGKTPMITSDRFGELGYQLVIFPVTALRVMLKAIQSFYRDLLIEGTQASWMDKMATRKELYGTIEYDKYTEKDRNWSNSK